MNQAMISAADPLRGRKKPVVKGSADPEVVGGIKSQFEYMRDYINSPKYKERLYKIVNTERNIQNSMNPATRFNSELLSSYNVGIKTPEIINSLVVGNNSNLDSISNRIDVGPHDLGRNVAGVFDSSIGDVRLNDDLLKGNPTVPVHEFSHGTLNGNAPFSTQLRDKYVSPLLISPGTPGWDPTVANPAELKARVDAVRFLMKKNGIVDPGASNITPEHINKLRDIKGIKNDFNYKQLDDQLKGDKKTSGLLWLLNNIAKAKTQDSTNGTNS